MNCRLNYLYERFPNNPDFAAHLEKIELEIWNTLKNENFPRFQYEGVNYFTLSSKNTKEYNHQMKVLQELRDKFGSQELFLMKKLPPFDYSLIQVGMGKIVDKQFEIFNNLQLYLDSKKDKDLRNKYFPNSNTTTSKEILEKISKSNHPLNVLASHLLKYVDINNVKISLVEFISESTSLLDSKNASAIYIGNENRIEIKENSIFKGKGSEPTIIHEILHALTQKELERDNQVRKDFEKLFEHSKKLLGEYNPITRENYFNADIDEFLVAIFTDSDFINKIKNYPAVEGIKYKNFLEEVFDYILSLFKIKKENLFYEQAYSLATNILENAKKYNDEAINNSYDLFEGFNEEVFNKYNKIKNSANISQEITEGQFNQIEQLKQSDPRWSKYSNEDIQRFIDSIFPDSKINDIVYHGSLNKFDTFDKNAFQRDDYLGYGTGFYFTDSFKLGEYYKTYLNEEDEDNEGYLYHVLLNIKTPFNTGFYSDFPTEYHYEFPKYKYDSIIGGLNDYTTKENQEFNKKRNEKEVREIVVFESEQIYILNSDKAIADMEKFINSKKDDNFEGINFVFKENPELEKIGTKEEYSEYLKTIFPNSKIKNIVFRAGASSEDEYSESITDYLDLGSGYYFSPKISVAQEYGTPNAFIINTISIKDANIVRNERVEYYQNQDNFSLIIPTFNNNGKYDSIIDLSKEFKDTYELVVFNEDNFFKLGSNVDINNFKKFINSKKNNNFEEDVSCFI